MTDCAGTAPRSNSHLPLRLSLVKFWPWSRSGSFTARRARLSLECWRISTSACVRFMSCSRRSSVAKKRRKRTDPEFEAQWQRNHDRLQRLLEKRLAQEGVTKEQALQRLRPDE